MNVCSVCEKFFSSLHSNEYVSSLPRSGWWWWRYRCWRCWRHWAWRRWWHWAWWSRCKWWCYINTLRSKWTVKWWKRSKSRLHIGCKHCSNMSWQRCYVQCSQILSNVHSHSVMEKKQKCWMKRREHRFTSREMVLPWIWCWMRHFMVMVVMMIVVMIIVVVMVILQR